MFDYERLILYKQYLNTIQAYLDEYFDSQKEYICCKKGCAFCCEKGTYPYSEIEFNYLKLGFLKLNLEEQQAIMKRVMVLKEEYKNTSDKKHFMHRCPFLNEENSCSLYDYRGLICRTFGLLKPSEKGEIIIPFCQSLGLNYSKVYNKEKKIIDEELVLKEGYKNRPKAYDLSFKTLMDKNLFKDVEIDFGEIKSIIEWL